MFQRLGRVFEKEKARLAEGLKTVRHGGARNAEEARRKKQALDELRASYKALLQVGGLSSSSPPLSMQATGRCWSISRSLTDVACAAVFVTGTIRRRASEWWWR